MRSFSFISASLAVASFITSIAAYTQPTGMLQGNPIYTPSLNELVPVGKPYKITWNPTTPGTVTLVLLRGPSTDVKPLYAIAEKIENSGSYEWTPATSLEPDVTHYGIQLIVDATGDYQYSTQFGISNPGFVSSSSSSSAAATSSEAATSSGTSSAVYVTSSSYTSSNMSSYATSTSTKATSSATATSTSTAAHSTSSTYMPVSTKPETTSVAYSSTLVSSVTTRASTTTSGHAAVTSTPAAASAAVSTFASMKVGFVTLLGVCGFMAMML